MTSRDYSLSITGAERELGELYQCLINRKFERALFLSERIAFRMKIVKAYAHDELDTEQEHAVVRAKN